MIAKVRTFFKVLFDSMIEARRMQARMHLERNKRNLFHND
jgi:hypothetical protein